MTGSTINTPIEYYDFGFSQEMPLRTDEVTSSLIYIGYCLFLTSNESAPVWKIKKMQQVGSVWVTSFADGDMKYDNSWTNRAALTYK